MTVFYHSRDAPETACFHLSIHPTKQNMQKRKENVYENYS